jgi:hypothetical protein
MPYNAFIAIDGTEHALNSCSYTVFRGTNAQGEPHGDVDSGKITFSVTGMDKSPFFLWAATEDMKKSGKIIFKDTKNKTHDRKTLEFTDAYAVEFQEGWGNGGDSVETVTITARTIKMQDKEVKNEWGEPA